MVGKIDAYLQQLLKIHWLIGTRPIAPLLIDMSSRLSSQDRKECKSKWVNFFSEFFTPIIKSALDGEWEDDSNAFHFYILEKER